MVYDDKEPQDGGSSQPPKSGPRQGKDYTDAVLAVAAILVVLLFIFG